MLDSACPRSGVKPPPTAEPPPGDASPVRVRNLCAGACRVSSPAGTNSSPVGTQAACLQVWHVQSEQTQVAHESLHDPHSHTLWLHVGQVQDEQSQVVHSS
jgi:hypothetical protein